jgi:hypothetical protein
MKQKNPDPSCPYLRMGFVSRDTYLRQLAEDYEVPLRTVLYYASLLGDPEDLDAISTFLEEHSYVNL